MTYKMNILYAWIGYIGIILTEFLVDYTLRIKSEDFYSNGMPEVIWFSIQLLAALAGGYFILTGVKHFEKLQNKIFYIVCNMAAGLMFYFLAVYSYVLGLGIDSL